MPLTRRTWAELRSEWKLLSFLLQRQRLHLEKFRCRQSEGIGAAGALATGKSDAGWALGSVRFVGLSGSFDSLRSTLNFHPWRYLHKFWCCILKSEAYKL